MSKVIQLDNPQPHESILKEEQMPVLPAKYIRASLVHNYIHCSKATANRLIEAAENTPEFENISISVSSGLKLIVIERLDAYLVHINSKWK
ncbi:hypothetical protein [Macrococcus equipercicus]|uniref:Uncharacterized protein n=1 Tax=Macrococcus equipercicus TaxID=69967 RepID=A0A9Q9BPF5_9STAP|nr:hypothetical protein [Macrococcus equipercicus]UTH13024.1 hypothetical protein KFV11_07000 [Macrococcus equipercicus]